MKIYKDDVSSSVKWLEIVSQTTTSCIPLDTGEIFGPVRKLNPDSSNGRAAPGKRTADPTFQYQTRIKFFVLKSKTLCPTLRERTLMMVMTIISNRRAFFRLLKSKKLGTPPFKGGLWIKKRNKL